MEVKYECLPCITRQLIKLATKLTENKDIQKSIIQYGLGAIHKNYLTASSPYITGLVYNFAKEVTGIIDPYKDEKKEFNKIAKMLIKELLLREQIANSDNPIDTAVRLSIAGNIIDFSLGININKDDIRNSINHCLRSQLYGNTINDFSRSINEAKNIIFIGDNAGEIVFDKLLLEKLPSDKITYVVKGGPIVNDATTTDAIESGIDKLVNVIDSGAAFQGIEFNECSESFLKAYDNADLIISKGQANFESLSDKKDKPIYYLLRAKCKIVSKEIGCDQHQFVLLHNYKY